MSREQIVTGAADMIRRRGLNATSIREVAKHAGTPLGSTYHYFPGGKTQLATEAVEWAAGTVSKVLTAKLRKGPVDGLRAFFALWRQIVTESGFQAGCPVLAVSIEENASPQALVAAADAFRAWSGQLAASLEEHGVASGRARSLAHLCVSAAEGAVALCRAQRSIDPLDDVAAELTALLQAATEDPEMRHTVHNRG
ncbi:TetR/AcrR family transcriptional regulator [Lentzea flaviverrucosa]|uniref:Transcriptional regulator, TetR family n=1 Tax=Lentzea flaviverrucosa TaxID=200379 RepID=A0A1H9TTQ2_9PSEU|nr:TetR/AcrR family transcriptional regulator [Lentzea flaviverrucosa]RDI33479.1 TetR family transcriptional regulator [Lentzea flaviverrucosa]SES00357.1 transcriptional regulator, TetR family [Lentzea flaviverrucosa]